MRLSRPRVLLRGLLLAVGGAYMLWRARLSWQAARELEGAPAALSSRLALVFALVAALAFATAAAALLSLRPRRRPERLGLRPPGGSGDDGPRPG